MLTSPLPAPPTSRVKGQPPTLQSRRVGAQQRPSSLLPLRRITQCSSAPRTLNHYSMPTFIKRRTHARIKAAKTRVLVLIVVVVAAASSCLLLETSGKEIDTKLDLLQEESLAAPGDEQQQLAFAAASSNNKRNARQYYTAQQQQHYQRPIIDATRLASASDGAPTLYNDVGGGGEDLAMASAGSSGDEEAPRGVVLPSATRASSGERLATANSNLAIDFPQTRNDLPKIDALNVKCEKNHMTVNIVFSRPFYGMVFSKGHYNNQNCVHLPPNSGQTSANFDIHLNKCGMTSSGDANVDSSDGSSSSSSSSSSALAAANGGKQQPSGLYIENTIIVQFDAQVQEIWDQARRLRCTWYDYYEKAVTFRPYNVDMLDAVTANFLGDNIQCWMQIQVGKGPWASEVAGIVKIGQTMTMVLAIKDDDNKFDMLVRNCIAHDGAHAPIQLVDEFGCVARPKIMGKFNKVRNFGTAATVASYAHFQAFKFPDSMSVHFQCTIQVCRSQCPEPVCPNSALGATGGALAAASSAHTSGAADTLNGGAAVTPTIASSDSNSAAAAAAASNGDYAALGSEIVAFKERLAHRNNASASLADVRLDEHQDRVQVHLDTSMLAGAGVSGLSRAPLGALPPHLLHAAAAHHSPPTHRSAPPPPPSSSSIAGSVLSARATMNRPVFAAPQHSGSAAAAAAGRARVGGGVAAPQLAASHSLRHSPYSMSVARLGEQAPPSSGRPRKRRSPQLEQMLAALLAANATLNGSSNSKQPPRTTTSVQTRRSIQVVSPDDVAFSLLDGASGVDADTADDQFVTSRSSSSSSSSSGSKATTASSKQRAKLICVSAVNVIVAVALTCAAFAASVAFAVLVFARRQRNCKQARFDYSRQDSFCGGGGGGDGVSTTSGGDEQTTGNRCIAQRLYSQFAPANYWPASTVSSVQARSCKPTAASST